MGLFGFAFSMFLQPSIAPAADLGSVEQKIACIKPKLDRAVRRHLISIDYESIRIRTSNHPLSVLKLIPDILYAVTMQGAMSSQVQYVEFQATGSDGQKLTGWFYLITVPRLFLPGIDAATESNGDLCVAYDRWSEQSVVILSGFNANRSDVVLVQLNISPLISRN